MNFFGTSKQYYFIVYFRTASGESATTLKQASDAYEAEKSTLLHNKALVVQRVESLGFISHREANERYKQTKF